MQRIRELEASNTGLREKLMVAKQQLVGSGSRPPAARRSPARRQVRWMVVVVIMMEVVRQLPTCEEESGERQVWSLDGDDACGVF